MLTIQVGIGHHQQQAKVSIYRIQHPNGNETAMRLFLVNIETLLIKVLKLFLECQYFFLDCKTFQRLKQLKHLKHL